MHLKAAEAESLDGAGKYTRHGPWRIKLGGVLFWHIVAVLGHASRPQQWKVR